MQAALAQSLEASGAQLIEAAKSLRNGSISLKDPAEKTKIVGAAKAAIKAVESPMDMVVDTAILLSNLVAIRLFADWKAFQAIPSDGSISYTDLAGKIGADANLTSKRERQEPKPLFVPGVS
jgi:hypothetical protein